MLAGTQESKPGTLLIEEVELERVYQNFKAGKTRWCKPLLCWSVSWGLEVVPLSVPREACPRRERRKRRGGNLSDNRKAE